MPKTIYWVYQDCPLCGQRKNWAKQQLDTAGANGLEVMKVSFATIKGRELIGKAFEKKQLRALPFFTDGRKFSKNISDFVKRESKTQRGKRKVLEDGATE